MKRKHTILSTMLLTTITATASIAPVDSVALKNLNTVAASIQSLGTLTKADRTLRLPQLPAGYQLKLKGTDKHPVVDTLGNVYAPLVDSDVMLYFQLTDTNKGLTIDVENIPVKVEGEFSPVSTSQYPEVIPAVREWIPKNGTISLPSKGLILIDPSNFEELQDEMLVFADDLKKQEGFDYKIKKGNSHKNAIYVTLNSTDKSLGEEGYRLYMDEGFRIEAVDAKGAFWGTRTLLQLLNRYGENIPNGIIRDYPKYKRRGFMLDVARKFFKLQFLKDYVKIMSYYKMNEFQVHLNDNGFLQFHDNDWSQTYSAFRLECETYPELTANDGAYKKREFADLQRNAALYGVNVIPEIDAPAHSLAFSHYDPTLGSEKYGLDHLDLSNPKIYPFLDALYEEFITGDNPAFVGPDVHIGTDEYSKEVAEDFRKFTDHYIRHIQKLGKRARVWGALTHAKGQTPVTSEGVIMNAWYNGYADPKDMIDQGYELISTPDGWLYIVPAAGYYYDYLNLKNLYEKWEPNRIGNQTFAYGHPSISGGMFAVWNDHCGNGISEKDVHHRAFPAMQMLAQKMWMGTDSVRPYSDFERVAQLTPEAPGLNLRGLHENVNGFVLNYDFQKGQKKGLVQHQTKIKKGEGLIIPEKGYVETPLTEIGYGYSVSFEIKPEGVQDINAILFSSPNALVIINEARTGNLGFKRDGYVYTFNYAPQANLWHKIRIEGDNKGTSLYVDDKLIERLEGKTRKTLDLNGKEN
ncbi:MAG: family 20 glycosylhydrolase, partial [Bacteroidales bacterium]